MPLKVGDVCFRGHRVKDESQLKITVRSNGKVQTRCRDCVSFLKKNPEKSETVTRKRSRLQIGMMCPQYRHNIESEADLAAYQSDGIMKVRCRKCLNDASNRSKRRQRAKKREEYERTGPGTILEVGHCQRGHVISSEADVFYNKTGVRPRCRQCQAASGSMREDIKRYVILRCKHEIIFTPPLPSVEDILYCQRCRDYQVMEGYGDVIREDAS